MTILVSAGYLAAQDTAPAVPDEATVREAIATISIDPFTDEGLQALRTVTIFAEHSDE